MLASTELWRVGKLENSCYLANIVHLGKFWLLMKGNKDWLVGFYLYRLVDGWMDGWIDGLID